MPVTKERVHELIESHQHHPGDSGSSEVQIAILTERIRSLTEHLQRHPNDHGSRRGLFKLIGQRRRLLNYLERTNIESYRKILGELELRR